MSSETVTRGPQTSAPWQVPWRRWCAPGAAIILLAVLYAYLWLWLDPLARYHFSAPVFFSSVPFLEPFLRQPGGLLEYVASGMGQLDYQPAWGALACTLVFAWLSGATAAVLRQASGRAGMAWIIPALLVLSLYNRYLPGVLEIAMGIALAATAAWALPQLSGPAWRDRSISCLAGAVLFYLAGPGASLLFIILAGLLQWVRSGSVRAAERSWIWLLPWLTAVVWRKDVILPTITQWDGSGSMVLTAVLAYAFLPMSVLAVLAWTKWLKTSNTRITPAQPWPAIVQTSLLTLSAFALFWSFDPERRALLRIQSAAEHRNWQGVLEASRRLREYPAPARLQIHRALFYLERLNSDLFSFPQAQGADLLASLMDGLNVCLPLSDTLQELGHFNLAERYLHEFLEIRGERPELLWRLAWINLVKERPQAARIFLNQLRKVPFHHAEAERWLASIQRDPTLASEEQVLEARQRRVTIDQVERVFPTEDLLRPLVRPDRPNRMAAEYLMAEFLLTRQCGEVAGHIALINRGGARPIPRHCEEAILACRQERDDPALKKVPIRPETAARFDAFRRAVTRQTKGGTIPVEVLRDFGDSYWFYDLFGRSAPGPRR